MGILRHIENYANSIHHHTHLPRLIIASDRGPLPPPPAAAVDNLEVARCLLNAGASTEEAQAGTLNRALHLAAFQGSRSVLTILLQVNGSGFGCVCKNPKPLKRVLCPVASIGTALQICKLGLFQLRTDRFRAIGCHKQAGADFSARNAQQETPLHHACCMMDIAIVSILLHEGADEAARNINNQTCSEVVGHGLDEEAGGRERGDPAIRKRISTMLARAPAERAWRRRSWIVMMRAREAAWQGDCSEGYGKGQKTTDIFGLAEAAGTAATQAVGGREGKHRCSERENGDGRDSRKHGIGAVGGNDELLSCVAWVVRTYEEGIFREAVSFL